MKIEQTEKKTIVSTVESTNFELSKDSTAHIMHMLRTGIYSNPIAAVVRELFCNAKDSVVEAGGNPETDVIVTLPKVNETNPEFSIEDKGIGLSHEDVLKIYRNYGDSTKRESDDVTGCLGIGSKSPFAYTDSFSIVSIKDGEKNVYLAAVVRDSVDDMDGRGGLHRLRQEKTNEPNGVKVSLSVQSKDVREFHTSWFDYSKFLRPFERPHVINGDIFNSTVGYVKKDKFFVVSEDNFYFYDTRNTTVYSGFVLMGSVPYEINERNLPDENNSNDYTTVTKNGKIEKIPNKKNPLTFSYKEKLILKHSLIYADMGSVDFAISREELRYTQKTLKFLKEKINEIEKVLTKKANEVISNINSEWEAYEFFSKHLHFTSRGAISFLFKNVLDDNFLPFKWNGKEIKSCNVPLYAKDSYSSGYFSCILNKQKLEPKSSFCFDAHSEKQKAPCFIVYHGEQEGALWRKRKQYINGALGSEKTEGRRVYFVSYVKHEPNQEEGGGLYDSQEDTFKDFSDLLVFKQAKKEGLVFSLTDFKPEPLNPKSSASKYASEIIFLSSIKDFRIRSGGVSSFANSIDEGISSIKEAKEYINKEFDKNPNNKKVYAVVSNNTLKAKESTTNILFSNSDFRDERIMRGDTKDVLLIKPKLQKLLEHKNKEGWISIDDYIKYVVEKFVEENKSDYKKEMIAREFYDFKKYYKILKDIGDDEILKDFGYVFDKSNKTQSQDRFFISHFQRACNILAELTNDLANKDLGDLGKEVREKSEKTKEKMFNKYPMLKLVSLHDISYNDEGLDILKKYLIETKEKFDKS